MERLILYDLPFDSLTLLRVEDMVRQSASIVSPSPRFDQYSFLEYAKERDIHNSQFHALFDLNVTANVLRMADSRTVDQSMRDTAALLSLLIIADTVFEIGFGMLEYVQKNSTISACNLINLFRSADNVAPNIYADIALGRKDKLLPTELPPVETSISSFTPELHHNWHMHYMGLLGLVAISKGPGRPVDKICRYLKWMWSDFVFSAPCILFSIIYLSSRPFKGMLKDIGSKNPVLVLNGIRNAAWDLATAHYWCARVTDVRGSGDIWVLCTFDRALREIASQLLTDAVSADDHKKISYFVSSYWPGITTDRIMNLYIDLQGKAKDPSRKIYRVGTQENFLAELQEFERLAIIRK